MPRPSIRARTAPGTKQASANRGGCGSLTSDPATAGLELGATGAGLECACRIQRNDVMNYTAHFRDFTPNVTPTARDETNPPKKIGFWRRLSNGARNYRQRRTEREIARFIQGRGGHLTDELERDLMRHMTSLYL
jgi:hypothetical protein